MFPHRTDPDQRLDGVDYTDEERNDEELRNDDATAPEDRPDVNETDLNETDANETDINQHDAMNEDADTDVDRGVIDGEVVDEHETATPLDGSMTDDPEMADDREMSESDEAVITGEHSDTLDGENVATDDVAADTGNRFDMRTVDDEALLEDEDEDADEDDEDADLALDTADDDEVEGAAEPVLTSETVVAPVIVDEPADQDACATPDAMDTVSDGTAGLGNATNGEMRPGEAPVPGADVVDIDTDGLHDRWQQAQLGFIDDPRSSTADAHAIAADAVEAHITALRDRLTALDGWQQESTPDTEVLRAAMQGYRGLIDALSGTTH
ncbi:MAG TPA: hypothetical protein VGJ28_19070 [Micromonosporaceae bacterium]